MKGMSELEELIGRLMNIHNSTNNIGWGVSEYSPLMRTGDQSAERQCVLVVGHNVYKKIYTMFVEMRSNASYCVYLVKDNKPDEVIVLTDSQDEVIKKIIAKLKEWFPEKRRERV